MSIDNQNWPAFLDNLDSHSIKAAEEFYLFTARLLLYKPPKLMHLLNDQDKEDVIQEIVIHCIQNDFRILRKYEDKGRPFAAWLYFIARNKIIDFIRKLGRETTLEVEPTSSTVNQPASGRSNPGGVSILSQEHTEAVEIVKKCLEMIDKYCRLLLKMAAQEFLPREMVRVLGWPAEKAKKVSNDLGYCRKKLSNLLRENGLNIAEYL